MKEIVYKILIFLLLISCTARERKPDDFEYINRVLIAKTSVNTKYILAFNDGYTKTTSFGWYSCLKIGDTIKFSRFKKGVNLWKMNPKCESN